MSLRIEDYALIGDRRSAALVGADGSIDWLCWPRFDSPACFSALVGGAEHGRWMVGPPTGGGRRATRRRYSEGTLILETEFESDAGACRLVDFMPALDETRPPSVVRRVIGLRGKATVYSELVPRFDYGSFTPAIREVDLHTVVAGDGTRGLTLRATVPLRIRESAVLGEAEIHVGETVTFVLSYTEQAQAASMLDASDALRSCETFWREWSARCTYAGPYRDSVLRSLLTLEALTYAPTGGIIAAPTTSLPQQLGGVRNWDYRYCWLRDASLTLRALMACGYYDEADAWRRWLVRAVADDVGRIQVVYGVDAERDLAERELPWLPGYQGARPVRVGNAAHAQLQIDALGETLAVLHLARAGGLAELTECWPLERELVAQIERLWSMPDHGLWEVRGPPQHFTHSKVMAWVGVDRAVASAEAWGLDGPLDRWRGLRERIHADVCARAYDPELGTFVQAYGSRLLDATLLIIPLTGFLSGVDDRVRRTVNAVERQLVVDGLVARYDPAFDDGLPSGQGAFLACSFWLVEALAAIGRVDDATSLFERLLELRNDVGLLAEQYDVGARRQTGNFPQAFSHVALITAANRLATIQGDRTANRKRV